MLEIPPPEVKIRKYSNVGANTRGSPISCCRSSSLLFRKSTSTQNYVSLYFPYTAIFPRPE